MAHFAQLDDSNVVLTVNVIADEDCLDGDTESEAVGIAFCKSLWGADTIWKQTSYNGTIRKQFAEVGGTYDASADVFILIKPFASWTLNGSKDWTEMIKGFYSKFHTTVEFVKENAQRESGERVLGVDPESGRSVKVRLGKFGPMAQIGDPDEEEKPIYASLGLNQQLENISFDEVMSLFEMPKTLGVFEDQEIVVNNGRFGPYLKHNEIFISLPKGMLPTEVDLETSITLIKEKQLADAPVYVFKELPVTKGVGRFGPFLKWSGMFINVNKKYDFDNLSNDDIVTLIEEKIQKEIDKVIHDWSDSGIRVEKARWGRHHIIRGKQKVEIGKDIDAVKLTLKEAEKYLGKSKVKTKPKAKKKVVKKG